MKSKYILCWVLLLNVPHWLSSQTNPTTWVTGSQSDNGSGGYGNALIRFQDGAVDITPQPLGMNFESTVATMTDTSGNLLFYTNGCAIANGTGEVMENGEGINPGLMHDWTCATAGYVAPFGAVPVASPERSGLYYLFHIGVDYTSNQRLMYGPFYYTIIDMEANGGAGKVVSKNNILIDAKNLAPFSVTRHANGRDWWVLVPEAGTNRYHSTLLTAGGMRTPVVQAIGTAINCRYIGMSAFSLQGTRFARQQSCGLHTFTFDRCTGELSNPQLLPIANRAFGGGGVQFSPSGNKVLTTTQMSILAANLTQNQPVLDTVAEFLDVLGNNFNQLQYGPDGVLYISTMDRNRHIHIVRTPDEDNIGLRLRGLTLPVYQTRSLPNLPNYKLGRQPDVLCPDPYQGFNFQGSTTISPNPTSDVVIIKNPDQEFIQYTLYNMAGQWLGTERFAPVNILTLPLGTYPAGVYHLTVQSINGEQATFKVVTTQ
jgi:hypothetical protein